MTALRLGSLCTGIAGLEHGLDLAGLDTQTVFVSDIDARVCVWLEANTTAPNLRDFTALDELPPVDILTAGFPCQPFSAAGKNLGLDDERYLFDDIARLVGRMDTRPLLFLENVPGLLTGNDRHAMARIVYRLAEIGYGITWGIMEAAAVGAPHRRARWWGLAFPADADVPGRRQHRRPESVRPKLDPAQCNRYDPRFGKFGKAIARWESVTGRRAPDPTLDGLLSPNFVEWMMGYPDRWVTGTLHNRRHALHVLGNAVVPQAAAAAFTALLARVNDQAAGGI